MSGKPTPGIYPRLSAPKYCNKSELKVYESLKEALPKGWYCWHSMRARTINADLAECDVLIIDPQSGALAVEVKGGQISKRGGQWYQYEKPFADPVSQVHNFKNILLNRFREKGLQAPFIGTALCFCDTMSSSKPSQDDMRGLVFC